ncbi:MAG TPA: hypothetical protein VM901_13185 [Bdellovibrionota bacterium]|nr:hypothetical protein [Bdellovibrionota bacterium]
MRNVRSHWTKGFAIFLSATMLWSATSLDARTFDFKEQSIYTEAFVEFVDLYRGASEQYKKQGPHAFVERVSPASASVAEKAYARKILGSLPTLPKLSSDSALLIVDATEMGAGVHTIEVSNIDDGMLIVDGSPVECDPLQKDVEYLSKKIEASLDRSTMKGASILHRMSLVPTAHASAGKAIAWTVIGMVGGLATKWVWDKWTNRESDNDKGLVENNATPANQKHQ